MADWPIRSVLSRTSLSDRPISRIHEERQGALLIQSDFSGRTTPIKNLRSILRTNPQDEIVVSANHIHRSDYLRTDFIRTDHPSRRNSRLRKSQPSVRLSLDGLSLNGSSFRLNRQLSQSQPSVGLSLVGLSLDGLSLDGSSFGQKPSR